MYGASAVESKTYGVKFQARCIAAQAGEKAVTRFLIGTLSLREENEVHLIQLSEDGSSIVCEGLFGHQHEIWDLAACPFDPLLFSTVYASAGEYSAAVWRMPQDRYSNNYLELATQLPASKAPLKRVLWHAGGQTRGFLSLDEDSLTIWDLNLPSTVVAKGKASAGSLHQFSTAAWSPLDANLVATTSDTSISLWDLRSMSKVMGIESAHNMHIRDLDFNPKQENIIMSAGDDSKIRVWDLRSSPNTCLVDLPAHSHWIWRARYNGFHDDFILSGGTDSTVGLWHVPSASAAALSATLKAPSASSGLPLSSASAFAADPRSPLDHLAASFTDFEDSVYGVAWSSVDPWMFGSLSYDGRVVVDMVPAAVRSLVRRS